MRILIFLSVITLFFGCNSTKKNHSLRNTSYINKPSTFFQYNIWGAFVNRVFDGNMTIKELKEKGNIGLGSFDLLDGELVMDEGVVYRVREDGIVSIAQNTDEIVYADAVFLKEDQNLSITHTLNYDSLRKVLNKEIPSINNFYAFRISGIFDSITLGGLHKQSPPFVKGLDVLIPARPVFKGKNVKGTMIGFYCPQFIGDINAAGYHFHFISDDKKLGGHVMDMNATKSLKIEHQKLTTYQFRLPESKTFDTVKFDKSFQYNKK